LSFHQCGPLLSARYNRRTPECARHTIQSCLLLTNALIFCWSVNPKMKHLDVFEPTLRKTSQWLTEIMVALGRDQPQWAYHALRAVLHALRDRLPAIEAIHLGAQLPMLIRGFYYEGWTPLDKPLKMDKNEFLLRISNEFRNDPGADPLVITRTVIEVMIAHLDSGEMSKIASVLPADYYDFWPIGALA